MKLVSQISLLAILGLLSGVCSGFSIGGDSFGLFFLPGTIFALAVIIYFLLVKNHAFSYAYLLFILFSTISYTAAFYTTLSQTTGHDLFDNNTIPLQAPLFGGAVGGFLVVASFYLLVSRISLVWIIALITASSLLSLSLTFTSLTGNLFYLYIIWQAGMLLLFGIASDTSKQSSIITPRR